MGLLDALQQYISDAMPGGLLNPETAPVMQKVKRLTGLLGDSAQSGAVAYSQANQPASPELTKGILGFMPGIGDAISGYDAVQSAREGNYGEATLNGVGLLPFVPSLGGMIKSVVGRIPETGAETKTLAEMLKRAGEKSGYIVSHESSSVSPSEYVTFMKHGDDVGDATRQVRISNHADKYPELANGIRTSVDPATEVSFEQAANWLGREGFPTSLSKKFENVPTWEQYYESKRIAEAAPEAKLQRLQAAWLNKPKATRGPRPTIDDVK